MDLGNRCRHENRLFDDLNLSRNKFYVVYAGNLGKVQGVEVLVEAANLLKGNDKIHFVIFGNGSEENHLMQLISQMNLQNISRFPLQPMERVSEVYSMADVCVISCRPGTGGSGMPSKTWTIMAAGVPIIASFDMNTEMEKTINEAECGYCVESGNAKDLRDAVLQISNNHEMAARMAENSRRYAVEFVSKEKAVTSYIEVISKIVEK